MKARRAFWPFRRARDRAAEVLIASEDADIALAGTRTPGFNTLPAFGCYRFSTRNIAGQQSLCSFSTNRVSCKLSLY